MKLPITGEYPPDWKEISDRVWAEAGHRCIRCRHPYRKGEHGKGEWTPCDGQCDHIGPYEVFTREGVARYENAAVGLFVTPTGRYWEPGIRVLAQWRVATVHHLDGNKANCVWWNLLAVCQRCHLHVQARVDPQAPYFLEHSEWFKPYAAGFYAHKYEGLLITRALATARMSELLAYERLA